MQIDKLFNQQLKGDRVFRWFSFIIIALAVLICYFPTLCFPPRGDQVVYLAEIANKQNPMDLVIGTYDLNRHRVYSPGDELLFRPLIYVFLGSEQAIFGHHFWAWQLMGLMTHLILIWVMLRFLWHLSGPWLGFAGTWAFALSVVNYELVSWSHLTSYILMMALIILSLEQAFFCFEENEVTGHRIARMMIYLTFACFIYETANLFTLCIMGGLLLAPLRGRFKALMLMMPVSLYSLFSFYNYVYVNHIVKLASTHGVSLGKYLWSVGYVILWWLYEGLFDGMYSYVMTIRTMFERNEVMVFKPLIMQNPEVVLALIILLAFGAIVWMSRRESIKRVKFLIVLSGILVAYVAVIVIGRYQEMGSLKQAVRINSYYLYPFWVIMVMMIFSLMVRPKEHSRLGQGLVILLVTANLIQGVFQGNKIYSMASGYAQATSGVLLLVVTLDLLIQEKGHESNFSFYVHPRYIGNSSYLDVHKKTDPPGRVYTFAELLYPQYFQPRELAKYKFLDKKSHS